MSSNNHSSLLDATLAFRTGLIKKLESVPEEKWDLIPQGHQNNIRWQCAHLCVTPGLLTYVRLGRTIPILSPVLIASARKGTNPASFDKSEDYSKKNLLGLMKEVILRLQQDAPELSTLPFEAFETSTGLVLKDLSGAFTYSSVHDGIHIGTVSAMLRQMGV